jgi:hypothetical protein
MSHVACTLWCERSGLDAVLNERQEARIESVLSVDAVSTKSSINEHRLAKAAYVCRTALDDGLTLLLGHSARSSCGSRSHRCAEVIRIM